MNRRQIARRSFDELHKRLMLDYQRARGGDKLRKLAALRAYMLGRLKEARQG